MNKSKRPMAQRDFLRLFRALRCDSMATEFIYSDERHEAAVITFAARTECEDPYIDGACMPDDPVWMRKYFSQLRRSFVAENYKEGRLP